MTIDTEVKTADVVLPEGASSRLYMTPAGRLKVDSTGSGGGGGGNVILNGINSGTTLAAGPGASDATSPRVTIANGATAEISGTAILTPGSVGATSTLITLSSTGTLQIAGTIGPTVKGGYIQNRSSVNAEVIWQSSTAAAAGLGTTIIQPYKAIPLSHGNDSNIYQGVVSVAGTSGMTLTLVQNT